MTSDEVEQRPARRWWPYVLALSLMANLLVGGVVIGHGLRERSAERMSGTRFVQLVPREFFSTLPRERRRELLRSVLDGTRDLRDMRDGTSQLVINFADAVDAADYKPEAVSEAVFAFSTGEESMAARSAQAIVEIVGKLSPDERKLLAAKVRDRAKHMHERRKK